MTDLPGAGRRRALPLLTAAGVIAVVLLAVLLTRAHRDGPGPQAGAPLPPASPGVVSAGYRDSHWRLTAVTDRRGTTAIPASVDAWLELAADGELLASDAVNTINGRFTATGAGFDVTDTVTTLAGYAGEDPVQRAVVTGIGAVTTGPPAAPSNGPEAQPVHVTVLSADRDRLTVQAGGVRLTFVRNGPAVRVNATPLPHVSSAAGR